MSGKGEGDADTEGKELGMAAWWQVGPHVQKVFLSLRNGKDGRCPVIKDCEEVRLLQQQCCSHQVPETQKQRHLSSPPVPSPLSSANSSQ